MNIEKLKAAAIASINHDGSNYYSHTYNHTKESNPATILELIERLEAAEKQRDELLNALKKVKSVGHGVMPKYVWITVEKAIASVKESK